MAAIKEHIRRLASADAARFAEFEAELARQGLYTHFYRSVVPHADYNLKKMRAPLVPILKEYLGFDDVHFSTNTLPDLPQLV